VFEAEVAALVDDALSEGLKLSKIQVGEVRLYLMIQTNSYTSKLYILYLSGIRTVLQLYCAMCHVDLLCLNAMFAA
jgi:hypothetical protein